MSLEIIQSLQYEIRELSIVSKNGKFDIRNIFNELNIYDSLFQPCMSGNIVIQDAVGLTSKLNFDGSEFLSIEISKDEDNIVIKKLFHIYKQTDRKLISQTSESYKLHFVSEEFTYSEQQRIFLTTKDNYSNVVRKILEDKLQTPDRKLQGLFEQSVGVKTILIPNLKPFDAINWCAKMALNSEDLPNFVFFENAEGYNFVSLSSLIRRPSVVDIFFGVKNLDLNKSDELLSARGFEVVEQYDYIDDTRGGVFAGTFIGFDPLTRTVVKKAINYNSIDKEGSRLNKYSSKSDFLNKENKDNTALFSSRKVVHPVELPRQNNPAVLQNNPTSITTLDDPEKWLFQRKAILRKLCNHRVKLAMPGNFILTSGFNVNLLTPNRSYETNQDDNLDLSVLGKYLIVGVRHIIQYDRHETVLELVSDSSNNPLNEKTSRLYRTK